MNLLCLIQKARSFQQYSDISIFFRNTGHPPSPTSRAEPPHPVHKTPWALLPLTEAFGKNHTSLLPGDFTKRKAKPPCQSCRVKARGSILPEPGVTNLGCLPASACLWMESAKKQLCAGSQPFAGLCSTLTGLQVVF